jgi:Protein of unknown function (DUF2911)
MIAANRSGGGSMATAPALRSPRAAILLAIGLLTQAPLAIRSQQPASPPPDTTPRADPATATPAAGTPAEGAAAPAGAAADEGERRRSRRRAEFDTTELALGADRKIELRFDQPNTADAAYAAILAPVDGRVVAFVKNRPLKLETPVDLRFGDVVVAAHNQVPDYPGVYSLWLKSVGGQWRLVFNHLADVWGTQHDPAEDAAEVPLEVATTTEPVETLTAKLEPAAGGGILRLTWGTMAWSVPFSVE